MSPNQPRQVSNPNQVADLFGFNQQKRQPKLPLKLHVLTVGASGYSFASLRDLEREFGIKNEFFSRVIRGLKKSRRVAEIIRTRWGVSIDECIAIYREHRERLSMGNPVTMAEAEEFAMQVRFRRSSISDYSQFVSNTANLRNALRGMVAC
jgi:hypothetical protein